MTPNAWRITKRVQAGGAFTGDGARLGGGRWNWKGTPVVYTAGSVSLAMLEVLVHFTDADPFDRYVLFPIRFDPADLTTVDPARLPPEWRASKPLAATRALGTRWARRLRSAVLAVPSVIVPGELNYLLNPLHPQFAAIKIGRRQPIEFDPRLLRAHPPAGGG